jgi:hypothetical protein
MQFQIESLWTRVVVAFIGVAFAVSVCAAPSVAFSPAPGFLPLSNYELVKEADDIVLARATSTQQDEYSERITFTILKSFKGRCREKTISTSGTTNPKYYYSPSQSDDFQRARPGTYAGSGSAYDYQIGKTYLLFLQHFLVPPGYPLQEGWVVGERVWQVGVSVLSRDREEVSETSSPWVQAVEQYVRIDRLNDYEKEKSALRELRALAAADTPNEKFPVALVEDIDRHFLTISPFKSYEDLTAFRRAEDGQIPDKVYYALAQKFEPHAFALLRERFKGDQWPRYWLEYLSGVSHPRRLQEIADLWKKWRVPPAGVDAYRVEDVRRDIANALTSAASDANYAVIIRALKGSNLEEHSGQTLVRWFADHISPGALGAVKEMVGTNYKDSKLLTTLLTLGDEDVVRWAIDNAKTSGLNLAALIAASPTALADKVARNLIAGGNMDDLEVMIRVYTNTYTAPNRNPHRWDRMRDIIALPNKSTKVVSTLRSSLNPVITKHTPDFERFEALRKLLETQLETTSVRENP